jgi:protein TilB
MVRITEELIRRKAEHHDGVLADLEELTLHQLEIERLEVVGSACRKLRILYLQNNIIPKLEGLHHLKDLRYLNMALNNITVIEGLSSCEFLNKLDFTVNFIDLDALEDSFRHLQSLLHLAELYMMGNPCTLWDGFRPFVVAMLPQLQRLDGTEVSRTERIQATQRFRGLRAELRELADAKRVEKGLPKVEPVRDPDDDTEEWSPEARVRMYRELAEQKEAQEKSRRVNEPPDRNAAKEQAEAIERIRAREASGAIRQCNEGRWEFSLEEEDGHGRCVLRIPVSRFLDTSLIDVDVNPTYVSVVIKGKVFRILWPEEVKAMEGKCQRSQTSGELMVVVPKVHVSRALAEVRRREKEEEEAEGLRRGGGIGAAAVAAARARTQAKAQAAAAAAAAAGGGGAGGSRAPAKLLLAEEMIAATRAVSLTGIVAKAGEGAAGAGSAGAGAAGAAAAAAAAADHVGDGMGGTALFRAAGTTRTPGSEGAAAAAAAARPSPSAPAPAAAARGAAGWPRGEDDQGGLDDDDEVPPLE